MLKITLPVSFISLGGFVGLFLGYSFFNIAASIVNASEKVTQRKKNAKNKIHDWKKITEMSKVIEDLELIKKEMDVMKENFALWKGGNAKTNILVTKATAPLDNDDWDK